MVFVYWSEVLQLKFTLFDEDPNLNWWTHWIFYSQFDKFGICPGTETGTLKIIII